MILKVTKDEKVMIVLLFLVSMPLSSQGRFTFEWCQSFSRVHHCSNVPLISSMPSSGNIANAFLSSTKIKLSLFPTTEDSGDLILSNDELLVRLNSTLTHPPYDAVFSEVRSLKYDVIIDPERQDENVDFYTGTGSQDGGYGGGPEYYVTMETVFVGYLTLTDGAKGYQIITLRATSEFVARWNVTVVLPPNSSYFFVHVEITNMDNESIILDEYPSHIHDGINLLSSIRALLGTGTFPNSTINDELFINGIGVIPFVGTTYWIPHIPSRTRPYYTLYDRDGGDATTVGYLDGSTAVNQVITIYQYTSDAPIVAKVDLFAKGITLAVGDKISYDVFVGVHDVNSLPADELYNEAQAAVTKYFLPAELKSDQGRLNDPRYFNETPFGTNESPLRSSSSGGDLPILMALPIGILTVTTASTVAYGWQIRYRASRKRRHVIESEGRKMGFFGKALRTYIELREQHLLKSSDIDDVRYLSEEEWLTRTKKGMSLLGSFFITRYGAEKIVRLEWISNELALPLTVIRSELQRLMNAKIIQGSLYGDTYLAIKIEQLEEELDEISKRVTTFLAKHQSRQLPSEEELAEMYELSEKLKAINEVGQVMNDSELSKKAMEKWIELNEWLMRG